jgi:hypothetical protein
VSDLVASLGQLSELYRVLFFENSAGVHAALVPRNDDLYLDEAFLVPIATINLRTGEKKSVLLHSGMIRYERMSNGHAYGIGWEREMGGLANTLLVYDLGMQKDLLREKFDHAQNPPIIARSLSLFFETPRRPELVMVLQSPTGKVLRYHREARQFMPLSGLSRAATAGIRFFNDREGKPWFAAVEGNENASLVPDYYRLVVQPMAGLSGSFVQDLDLEHPQNEISELEVIERPEGRLFLAWERTVINGKVRFARVHIIDQNTRSHTTASIPQDWPGTLRRKTLWDPVKGVLYAYFVRDEGTTPEIAEIYRPALSHREADTAGVP